MAVGEEQLGSVLVSEDSVLIRRAWRLLSGGRATCCCWRIRELWIRAHSRLGKIPVVLTLLGLSSSLQCTTKPSNFPLWEEKVIFLAFWGVLLISRKGVPTEMLPPNPGVLIHDWREDVPSCYLLRGDRRMFRGLASLVVTSKEMLLQVEPEQSWLVGAELSLGEPPVFPLPQL